MIDFTQYTYELKETIQDLVHTEMKNVRRMHKGYMFNCPLCGDKKQRGSFLLDNSSHGYVYKCFNDGCASNGSMSASKFVKKFYNDYHKRWLRECMTAFREDEEAQLKRKQRQAQNAYIVERRVPVIKSNEDRPDISNLSELVSKNKRNLLTFDTIRNYPDAMQWCKDRMIPFDIYSKWLFVPNIPENYLRNRIIIPFDNKNGDMYYYQARTIGTDIPKYKNPISDLRPIYGYYEADFSKPVIIVEGPIDSLFIENSIATLGTKFNDELIEPIKQRYFLFDNDNAGRDAALDQLNKGEYVFMWKRFISNFAFSSEKIDFNNLAILLNKQKFKFEELKPFFTNSILMKAFI